MKHRFNNTIVIALGGSILYPEEIDTKFIKQFASLIKQFVKKGKRFVIVTGGGRVSRLYQKAAGEISKITNEINFKIIIPSSIYKLCFVYTCIYCID